MCSCGEVEPQVDTKLKRLGISGVGPTRVVTFCSGLRRGNVHQSDACATAPTLLGLLPRKAHNILTGGTKVKLSAVQVICTNEGIDQRATRGISTAIKLTFSGIFIRRHRGNKGLGGGDVLRCRTVLSDIFGVNST